MLPCIVLLSYFYRCDLHIFKYRLGLLNNFNSHCVSYEVYRGRYSQITHLNILHAKLFS